LKKLVFSGDKNLNFIIGRNHKGRKNLTGDETSKLIRKKNTLIRKYHKLILFKENLKLIIRKKFLKDKLLCI
jgi:hypothetical protein